MKTFHIFHAINPCFEEVADQDRKYVGSVEAVSLEDAFAKAQNFERHWNRHKPCRSTSIGDVIQMGETNFMVGSIGFNVI